MKEVLIKLWRVINNPLVGLVLGLGVSYLLYMFSATNTELSFSNFRNNLIASSSIDSNIRIEYNGNHVSKLFISEIVLINSGSQYIDMGKISKTYPIRFTPNDTCTILSISTINRSRTNLKLLTLIDSSKPEQHSVQLKIDGDDGLEHGDGVVLNVLYTTPKDSISWNLEGRIKGNINPFVKLDQKELERASGKYYYGTLVFLVLGLLVIAILSYKQYQDATKSGKTGDYVAFSVFIILTCGLVILFIQFILHTLKFNSMQWLTN
jgi:hypothetical protein